MHLLPTPEEVVGILRETGALRSGHFEFPDGSHSNEYLQVPLAMRHYQYAKILSVGLSRLLRAHSETRALIPELSIVAPATGGLPVAYGICEALGAKQVYWAERESPGGPYRFRPFIQPERGEQVMLVDDILHSGRNLTDLRKTIESYGAKVVGVAVIVHQPVTESKDFGELPFFHLARLEASYYAGGASCDLCRQRSPVTNVWI